MGPDNLWLRERPNGSYIVGSNPGEGEGDGGTRAEGEDGEMADKFIDVLGVWITGVVSLLGLGGNCLSFIVLQRAFGRSPMFFVLRILSISDSAFLVSVFTAQTVVNVHAYPVTGLELLSCRSHVQYLVWPIMMTTQMTTVWLTVLVSCERWVAICHPLQAAAICTLSKVRSAVAVITVTSIVFNIPRYFEFGVDMAKTSVGKDPVYRYLYTCVLYSLLLFFVPLLLLLFLNLRLVLALRQGKRQWQQLQYRQRREQHLTVIPLTIVVIFFIGGTPSLAVNVADSINPNLFLNHQNSSYIVTANFLVVLNSASNFVVYCLLGKTFRSKISEMLHCRCRNQGRAFSVVVGGSQKSNQFAGVPLKVEITESDRVYQNSN